MIIPTTNIKRPYWISGFTGSGLSINKVTELMHFHQVYGCFIDCTLAYVGGARWRSWLRHYSTNRQVMGSIPYGVIVIFQ